MEVPTEDSNVKYTLNKDGKLFKENKVIALGVRSLNRYGYIINKTYYDFIKGDAISNAKMLSYYYVLTFDGDVYHGNSIIATHIKKIIGSYAITYDGYLFNLIEKSKTHTKIKNIICYEDDMYIYIHIHDRYYKIEEHESIPYYNLYGIVINNYINPLYDIDKICQFMLCLKHNNVIPKIPKFLLLYIFSLIDV